MKMQLEKTGVRYCVEVEKEKFIALLEYENIWHGGLKSSEPGLDGILRNMGCDDVDYDGHYMNYIYFSLCVEDDEEDFHKEILEVIEEYLQKAVEWKKNNV